jgi:multidrug efflux pump subunit AcrA (membrane-fusion protein)
MTIPTLLSSAILSALFISTAVYAMPSPAPQVVLQKAKTTTVADELSYPARVESAVQASVVSDIDGVVVEIPKSLGEKIKSGATIMRLQHTEPGFSYTPYRVQAPVAGVISLLKVTVGSRVTRGEALALITDPARVRMQVEFTPADLTRLTLGQRGSLTVRDQSYTVEISGMSPMIDPATGTAPGQLRLIPDPKPRAGAPVAILPAGLAGVVTFKLNPRTALLLPEEALVYRTDQTFIRKVDGKNKAERQTVKVGTHHDGMVEVLSGIKVGDTIIVRASRYVKDGETVEVQPDAKNE